MAAPAIPFLVKAAPFIAQGLNAVSNFFTNKQNKNTALEMYDRQRADALADWNRQNEYNSPAAQMQRFKDAGLSPHLIYGQTNTASPVRSNTLDTPKANAPQFDASQLLMPKQLEALEAQIALTKANTVKAQSETDWKNLNTQNLRDWTPYKAEQEYQKGLLLGAKNRTELENTLKRKEDVALTQGAIGLQKLQAKKLVADTNLSEANKAKAYQTITNLITTERLMQKKIVTEDFLQQVWQGRSNLLSSQKFKTDTDRRVADELLELKQMGVPFEVVKGSLGVGMQGMQTNYNIRKPYYKP